jgi:hypothetical protein
MQRLELLPGLWAGRQQSGRQGYFWDDKKWWEMRPEKESSSGASGAIIKHYNDPAMALRELIYSSSTARLL